MVSFTFHFLIGKEAFYPVIKTDANRTNKKPSISLGWILGKSKWI